MIFPGGLMALAVAALLTCAFVPTRWPWLLHWAVLAFVGWLSSTPFSNFGYVLTAIGTFCGLLEVVRANWARA